MVGTEAGPLARGEEFGPLVDTAWLAAHLGEARLRVVDVRWTLGKPGAGRDAWQASRIPGASFLDIDEDLSERGDPRRGRHPLPSPATLVATLARAGIGAGDRVVAYDAAAGAHAARLWWLLGWLGVPAAVLDGGWARWIAEARPIDATPPQPIAAATTPIAPDPIAGRVVTKAEVGEIVAGRRGALLLDARAPERFRGEVEPVDPKAGHIPGARNAPTADNLAADGTFRPPAELRVHFERLGVVPGREVVCYCGSGVTACHDLLALQRAGLGGARLYAGSWSEWSNDDLPIEK